MTEAALIAGTGVQHTPHVTEVHPRGPYRHPHLTGPQPTRLLRNQPHTVQTTTLPDLHTPRQPRSHNRRHQQTIGRHPCEAWYPGLAIAEGELG
ncbi:hypothetical protein AB0I77_53410, partial [Streptomyces sp. NPDC050619]|uniref:hypothetical protein n=1 Tax=Streptomyces sp. NPDC050619 TaxID=3157214 RepID=UPI00343A8302